VPVTTNEIAVESRASVRVPFGPGSVDLETRTIMVPFLDLDHWSLRGGSITDVDELRTVRYEEEPWQDQSIVAVTEKCDVGLPMMAR